RAERPESSLPTGRTLRPLCFHVPVTTTPGDGRRLPPGDYTTSPGRPVQWKTTGESAPCRASRHGLSCDREMLVRIAPVRLVRASPAPMYSAPVAGKDPWGRLAGVPRLVVHPAIPALTREDAGSSQVRQRTRTTWPSGSWYAVFPGQHALSAGCTTSTTAQRDFLCAHARTRVISEA